MVGIYKFTNKINGKSYIGQSIDIERRYKQHKASALDEKNSNYNCSFYKAIRKYGWDNFTHEILEEVDKDEFNRVLLNTLEVEYIALFNSYKNGYNMTPGGDYVNPESRKGEKNGRALLKEEDVVYIRECYNSKIKFAKVYEEYKDKISKRGLQKIWGFDTWQYIHPEYNNEENKYWHSHQAKANPKEVASNNKRKFSKEQVLQMRKDYDGGMAPKQVYNKYCKDTGIATSTIYNIVLRITYKDIE